MELHTDMGYRFERGDPSVMPGYTFRREFAPTRSLTRGLQRRLSRSFLFYANAGIGIGARRSGLSFGGFSLGPVNLSGQLNLGIRWLVAASTIHPNAEKAASYGAAFFN